MVSCEAENKECSTGFVRPSERDNLVQKFESTMRKFNVILSFRFFHTDEVCSILMFPLVCSMLMFLSGSRDRFRFASTCLLVTSSVRVRLKLCTESDVIQTRFEPRLLGSLGTHKTAKRRHHVFCLVCFFVQSSETV